MDDRPGPRLNWWRWLGWLITLLALLFVGRWLVRLDHRVWLSLRHLHLGWLTASLLVFQVWFIMRFAAWEMIVQRHGSEAQRHQTLRTWTLSELARYVPGNLWSFAAKYRGTVDGGAKPTGALQALAIEAFSQLSGAGLAAVLFYDIRRLWWGVLAIVVVFPFIIPLALNFMNRWKRWGQTPQVSIVESLGLLMWYGVVWTVFGVATAMVYWSFPDVPTVTFQWLIGVNVAAWFIGYISIITPMGLGVREVAFVKFTSAVLLSPVASLIALMTRLWFVLSELVFLGFVILWSGMMKRR